MQVLAREFPGVLYYAFVAALLLWLLFRAPLPASRTGRHMPQWVLAAGFAAAVAAVLAGIAYEVFVKDVPPPCPCGVPGCPEPPACDRIHDTYIRAIEEKSARTP